MNHVYILMTSTISKGLNRNVIGAFSTEERVNKNRDALQQDFRKRGIADIDVYPTKMYIDVDDPPPDYAPFESKAIDADNEPIRLCLFCGSSSTSLETNKMLEIHTDDEGDKYVCDKCLIRLKKISL